MTTDKTPATLAVDVLAVMARALSTCEAHTARTIYVGGGSFKRVSDNYGLPEVIAAVAELIEADTEFDEAAMEVSWYEAKTPYRSRNYRTACYVRQREAIALRTAALARVKGESA